MKKRSPMVFNYCKRAVLKMLFFLCCICFAITTAYAEDIRVMVSEVKETRTTGQFFAGLELKLKILGDNISDAKGLKPRITKAVDDTGRNLLKDEDYKADFEKPDEQGQFETTLKLKNPARKATAIKEVTGEIEIFVPKYDPGATSVIKNFMAQTGKTVSDPTLKDAKVDITVLTKEQFNKIKAEREKELKAQKEIGDAMVQLFGALFGGMMEMGENSVMLNVKDEGKKVIVIEFTDESGKKIHTQATMTMGDVKVFEFDKPLPQKAQVMIFLATPKALIKTPFRLTDIVLP